MAKNIWKNLEWKIAMLVVLIAASLSVTIYFIVYNQYYSLTIDKLKDDAVIVHKYAEEVIDERTFYELNSREDEESELYLDIYSQLDEIRRIANIKFLYTAKQNNNGEYIYVVDGLNKDDDDFRHVGDLIEDEIIAQLSQSLNNEIVFGDQILDTEWGIVYIVYFPFHDDKGDVIGAIGMEFDCEHLYTSFNRIRMITIVVSLILMLAFISIAYFAIKKIIKKARSAYVKMEETRFSMEQDLRKAEERTKLMLDSSPICTQIWDRELNTIDCNEAAVKLYGFKNKQEYVERFIQECSPEYQPDGRRSDERAAELVNEAFEKGYWKGEWIHRIPIDDTPLPAEVTLIRVNYGDDYVVLGYTRDLREHVKMMEDIEKQQRIAHDEHENLKILLDMLPVGIRIMRIKDGALLYANEASLKIFGCDSFEDQVSGVLGHNFMPETQPDGRKTIDVVDELFLKSGFTSELQCLKLSGEPFIARFSSCTINYKGEPSSLAVVEDVTEEKEYQQTLRNIAVKEQETSKAKSDFLAKMSHEIRTPMNAIIGMTELALRESKQETKNEHILTVKQAGANLLSIINDILDFSKIEAGRLEIIPAEYPVSSLINDVVSIIRMRLIDSQIRFVINLESTIPSSLYGDETRIRQAVLNLLSNAVKYTEKGYISFSIRYELIDEDHINLIMEVKDSGKGIKQDDIDKLFNDFTQFDLEKNRGIEGVGLGLAIASSTIKAMGGNISVHSEYGVGSTFTISVPQKFNTREALATVSNPEDKSVLLFERRKAYADSISYTIGNLGARCTLVVSDQELYDNLKKYKFEYLFISFTLYKKNEEVISRFGNNIKPVVLTEFGEAVPDKGINVLAMPVHSISIASILNESSDKFSYIENNEFSVGFTAPHAKVLVVDDINTNLKVVQGLLSPYNMHVALCKSGIEAIEAIRSEEYDLVFMDHKMPEMDGVEATQRIRKMGDEDPYFSKVPIVALTANAVSGTKEMFLESGFDDFLAKPIDIASFNAILEKWIPNSKQEAISKGKNAIGKESVLNIDGLDAEKGISRSGGTTGIYLEVLAAFYVDGIKRIEDMKKCLADGNISLYATHVHGLKSASYAIGADELSEAARALETAGNQMDITYISAHNPKYIAALEYLLRNIDDAIKNMQPEAPAFDTETLSFMLAELKSAIETFDAGAMDRIIAGLLTMTQGSDMGAVIRKISDCILMGEYDDAVSMIDVCQA